MKYVIKSNLYDAYYNYDYGKFMCKYNCSIFKNYETADYCIRRFKLKNVIIEVMEEK